MSLEQNLERQERHLGKVEDKLERQEDHWQRVQRNHAQRIHHKGHNFCRVAHKSCTDNTAKLFDVHPSDASKMCQPTKHACHQFVSHVHGFAIAEAMEDFVDDKLDKIEDRLDQIDDLQEDLLDKPTTPGCHIFLSDCKNNNLNKHKLPEGDWFKDPWGNHGGKNGSNLNEKRCDKRQTDFAGWCKVPSHMSVSHFVAK